MLHIRYVEDTAKVAANQVPDRRLLYNYPMATTKTPTSLPAQAQDSELGEATFTPQRNARWIDFLILGLIMFVLLGGVGKAFSDSDLFAEPEPAASAAEACPSGGCVKPPEELCGGRAVKALVAADGQRLYYAGDHPGYQGIIAMHVERGDRWFCTAAGAAASGFVAAP
jgi:hypothetical protein